MTEPTEFPINLRAFCQLAVDKLGYATIEHVLDILDANLEIVRDRALNCCFPPELAWAILSGEQGGSKIDLAIALVALAVVALLAFACALSGAISIG